MNLILHHLLKDIRALRWLLLLWAFVLVVYIITNLLILRPDYSVAYAADRLQSSPLLGLISGLVWSFVLVQLIQIEPVVGSTSFWLTRPVPRWVYIASKLLFIALFLFLPTLLVTPLSMVELHADPKLIHRSILSGWAWQAVMALSLLWVATFTRSLGQFFAVAGLLIPTVLIIFAVREISFIRTMGSNFELEATRGAFFISVLLIGMVVSLAVQHLIRKTSIGLKIGIGAAVVASLLGFFWPVAIPGRYADWFLTRTTETTEKSGKVDFADGWQNSLTWSQSASSDRGAVPQGYTTNNGSVQPLTTDTKPGVLASAPLSGTPDKITGYPIIDTVTAKFTPTGGALLELARRPLDMNDDDSSQFDLVKALQADLPGIALARASDAAQTLTIPLFSLDKPSADGLRGKVGALSLELYGHVHSLSRLAVIPLAGAAFARHDGGIIHVQPATRQTQSVFGMEIPMTSEDKPMLVIWDTGYTSIPSWQAPDVFYVLVDPQTNTGTILPRANLFGHFGNGSDLSLRKSTRDYVSLQGNEPLGRMVLYLYEFKPAQFFSSKLNAADVTMNPPPVAP